MSEIIKKILWRGLLWSIPLGLTVWLASMVFRLADTIMGPISRGLVRMLVPESWLVGTFANGHVPGMSLVLLVVALALIGSFISLKWGKTILQFIEDRFQQLPIVGVVYRSVRRISDMFANTDVARFEGVVLVPYPHPDVFTVAFVTGRVQIPAADGTMRTYLKTVTPNPPTGIQALPLIPESMARFVDMTIEDGIQFYISVSMVCPPQLVQRPVSQA